MKNEPDLSDISLRDLTVRHVKAGYSNVYKYVLVLEAERDALLAMKDPALELLLSWERRMSESMVAPTPEERIILRNLRKALAALPENLKGKSDE